MSDKSQLFKSLAAALVDPTAVYELRVNRKEDPAPLWERAAEFVNLHHLDLSGVKGFTQLPASLAALDLTHLLLNFTDVTILSADLIAAWPRLHTLHLAFTKIISLPDNLWQRPLQSLRLEEMRELVFPEQVWQIETLCDLLLFGLPLAGLPDTIGNLIALEKLDVGASQRTLTAVPDSIGQLTNLRDVRIWGRLTTLPDSIGQLSQLEKLDLTGNDLASLSATIGQLTHLRELDLHDNLLTSLPPEIGKLINLKKLNVSAKFNREEEGLKTLPPEIGKLINLDVLSLNYTQLINLPSEIGELFNLRCLYLRHGQLTAVPPTLTQLTNLQYLDLKENQLTTLPDGMTQLVNLRELALTGNEFPQSEIDKLDILKQKSKRYLEIKYPRLLAQKRPLIPDHAYTTQLNPHIYTLAEQLGATIKPTTRRADESVATKNGRYQMPEPLRQFMDDIYWQFTTKYKWEEADDNELWMLEFVHAELTEYECSFHRPLFGIGMYDGGNYFLVVDMADLQPEDPLIYTLDHESFEDHDPYALGLRLSELLAKLTVN